MTDNSKTIIKKKLKIEFKNEVPNIENYLNNNNDNNESDTDTEEEHYPRFIGLKPTYSTLERTGDYNSPPADIIDSSFLQSDPPSPSSSSSSPTTIVSAITHPYHSPFSIPAHTVNNDNDNLTKTTSQSIPTTNDNPSSTLSPSSSSILLKQSEQQNKSEEPEQSQLIEQQLFIQPRLTLLQIIRILLRYVYFIIKWSSPIIAIYIYKFIKCFKVQRIPAEKLKLTNPNDPNYLILPIFRRACWNNFTPDLSIVLVLYILVSSIYIIKYYFRWNIHHGYLLSFFLTLTFFSFNNAPYLPYFYIFAIIHIIVF